MNFERIRFGRHPTRQVFSISPTPLCKTMSNPTSSTDPGDSGRPSAPRLRHLLQNAYGKVLVAILFACLASLAIPRFLPEKYQALVVMEEKQANRTEPTADAASASSENASGGSPVCFLQMAPEIITSDKVIGQVARDLDLPNRLQLANVEEVIERVRDMVRTEIIQGTDMVRIVVTDTDKQRALDIANGICKAYRLVREDSINQQNQQTLAVLDNQLQAQEERLRMAEIKMQEAMVGSGVVGLSRFGSAQQGRADEVDTNDADIIMKNKVYMNELTLEIETLRAQIKAMQDLEGDDLIRRAAMLGIQDGTFQKYWPAFNDLVLSEEQATRSGIGPNHPDRQVIRAQLATVREFLVRAVEDLRGALGTKLAQAEKQLEVARAHSASIESDFQQKSIKYVSYTQARQDYYEQADILKELKIERQKLLNSFDLQALGLVLGTEAFAQRLSTPKDQILHPLVAAIIGLLAGGGLVFLATRQSRLQQAPIASQSAVS
jgi:capsular polysaccharide biosynthesis protein